MKAKKNVPLQPAACTARTDPDSRIRRRQIGRAKWRHRQSAISRPSKRPRRFPPVREVRRVSRENPRRTCSFTLEHAFDYFFVVDGGESNDTEFQNERCVRAVSFLLDYLSEHGNEDVEGFVASGLGGVLKKCSGNIASTAARRQRERNLRGREAGWESR